MARWKRAASVEGDGPRAWLLARRQAQLEQIRGLMAAATTFEFSAYLAGHRERQMEAMTNTIHDLEAGKEVQVSRWEFPRTVDLPGTSNQYEITPDDRIRPLPSRGQTDHATTQGVSR